MSVSGADLLTLQANPLAACSSHRSLTGRKAYSRPKDFVAALPQPANHPAQAPPPLLPPALPPAALLPVCAHTRPTC